MEEGEDAVVGEGIVPEAREGGGGEAEEAEREGGVGGERFDDFGGLVGGEGEAVGAEVVGEVEQRGGGGRGAENAGDGAHEVAARKREAARVDRGGGWLRRDGDGEGGARGGRRRGGDTAGVGRREAAGHLGRRGCGLSALCGGAGGLGAPEPEPVGAELTDFPDTRAQWFPLSTGPHVSDALLKIAELESNG